MAAKGQVIDEISSAYPMLGKKFWQTGQAGTFQLIHLRKKKIHILNQFLEPCRIGVLGRERGLLGQLRADFFGDSCC
ncbi:MAG: hypothetical protein ABSA57_19250 [Candidatus Acidiferrales bacterium]|jgi:hypothetical protein